MLLIIQPKCRGTNHNIRSGDRVISCVSNTLTITQMQKAKKGKKDMLLSWDY